MRISSGAGRGDGEGRELRRMGVSKQRARVEYAPARLDVPSVDWVFKKSELMLNERLNSFWYRGVTVLH